MRVLIFFAAALSAISALPAQEHWTLFKAKHGKSYESLEEEKVRFQIFQDNVQKINAHNALYESGLETYTMAVNKFADLTPEEFGAMFRRHNGPLSKKNLAHHVQTLTIPDSIDWRLKNAVLDVKDQGKCGAGWAFSAIGAIEGQNAIKNKKLLPLSQQQLIDCDTNWNSGCDGGDMLYAFRYIIKNGLNSEDDYPYVGNSSQCRPKDDSAVAVQQVVAVDSTESALQEAVGLVGPISATIYADPLQFYETGIFSSSDCQSDLKWLNHGVLVVGYGTEHNHKYWYIKNSLGTDWGEEGFLRLARDSHNQCGIASDTSYPILA